MEKVRMPITCGNRAQVMIFDLNYIRERADMDTGESLEGNYIEGQQEEMSRNSRSQTTDFQNKTGNTGKENALHIQGITKCPNILCITFDARSLFKKTR